MLKKVTITRRNISVYLLPTGGKWSERSGPQSNTWGLIFTHAGEKIKLNKYSQ